MNMNFVPETFEHTTTNADGFETYIHVEKNDIDGTVRVFTSNHMGNTKVTWDKEEARVIAKMLSVILAE